jgi:hypothetical protein
MYHICWNKQNKQVTSFVSKPCFTCFMTLLQSLSWSCYTNRFDMFQGMENTCCIYMLHKPHFIIKKLWNNTHWHIAYSCFKQNKCINEMNDAHPYQMQVQKWKPTPRVLHARPLWCISTSSEGHVEPSGKAGSHEGPHHGTHSHWWDGRNHALTQHDPGHSTMMTSIPL